MGAEQSSQGLDTPNAGARRTCYYELLAISEDATDEEFAFFPAVVCQTLILTQN